jgi:HEPN domain-containing protein
VNTRGNFSERPAKISMPSRGCSPRAAPTLRPFPDGVFGFHAQQSAEKALKAWMAYKGVKYKHTHDLMSLIDSLDGSGEEVAALGELVDLNSFAVQYRYETADEDDEPINRREVLDKIQRLFERVEEIIK